jgi:hypothetical protein
MEKLDLSHVVTEIVKMVQDYEKQHSYFFKTKQNKNLCLPLVSAIEFLDIFQEKVYFSTKSSTLLFLATRFVRTSNWKQ